MTSHRVSLSEKVLGLLVMFVVSIFFAGVVLAVGFQSRVDLAQSERAACKRAIADRLGSIKVRKVQAESAKIITDDPFQSLKTRNARRKEARELEVSVIDLQKRVDPGHGGQLICHEAFPNPGLF